MTCRYYRASVALSLVTDCKASEVLYPNSMNESGKVQRLSVSRLVRIVWVAGHGVQHGRAVWQKLAIATVSLRSLCHGAAWAWLDAAWDEAEGQFSSDLRFSDFFFYFSILIDY